MLRLACIAYLRWVFSRTPEKWHKASLQGEEQRHTLLALAQDDEDAAVFDGTLQVVEEEREEEEEGEDLLDARLTEMMDRECELSGAHDPPAEPPGPPEGGSPNTAKG